MRQKVTGFTLVELLIVIVVIAVLASITVVAYNGVSDRASYSVMRSDLSTLVKALALYKADKGYYPDSAGCTPRSGEYNYNLKWCGWDQGSNESFIPGLAPSYISVTPSLNRSKIDTDTYLYQTRASDNYSAGNTNYQLIRYKASGLSNAEKNNNPDLMTTNGYTGVGWGFKSDNSDPNWW